MQTPKSRTNSSGAPLRISPQSLSLEVSEKNSPRAASSEVSKKRSPRVVRQLKTGPGYSEPTASSLNLAIKSPKDRSPNVRKSPRSPLPEEKRPSRAADREPQISQLKNDLENVKNQLCASESSKKQAQKDAEEANQQLLALSSKLEESKELILEQSPSKKVDIIDLSEASKEQDHHSHDSAALASAFDEIKQLKAQLDMVAESEAAQTKCSESAQIELNKLKEDLAQTLVSVEEMKNQLSDCKKSESEAQVLVSETLMQLETAKKMVEALRSDGCKATEAYDAVKFELEQSRARIHFLEELVSKLKAETNCKEPQNKDDNLEFEVEQLRAALKDDEVRHNEELARIAEEMNNALQMVEQIKSASGQREAELEAELRKSSYEIEELKANLMDKETELQGICEENDALIFQLENMVPIQRECELEKEIKEMQTETESVKARLTNVLEDNEVLKLKINEMSKANKLKDETLEEARGAEREALMKVGNLREEIDRSNRKVARVTEQLEAAQAAGAELEAELRRLKVQSDQWRKAAEVAATMLSVGSNGQFVERTGSMDNNYGDDFDDDLMKKKNVNMLRRFGVLWKKPLK